MSALQLLLFWGKYIHSDLIGIGTWFSVVQKKAAVLLT